MAEHDHLGDWYALLESALQYWNNMPDSQREKADDDDRRVVGSLKDWLYG